MRNGPGIIGALLLVVLPAGAADVEDLVKKMRDPDAQVRRLAAKDLSEAGADAKPALPVLVKGLKDSDLYVRRFSAQAIGAIGPDAAAMALPAFRTGLLDPKETREVQEAIVFALGKLGKAGVDLLILAVKDTAKENDVRRKAIDSLGQIGPDAHSALAPLLDILKGTAGGKKGPTQADLRIEVSNALGLIANSRDDAVITALDTIVGSKDRNRALKAAAAAALKKIKARS